MAGFRLPSIPAELEWRLDPVEWALEGAGGLSIRAGRKTDLFTDPKDGAKSDAAPAALFTPPDRAFMLSARVRVGFASTYDAGVLHVRAGEDRWAKLCFEYSPQGEPMVVSVVNHGVSDDCNSVVIGRGHGIPPRLPERDRHGVPLLAGRGAVELCPLFLHRVPRRPPCRLFQPVADRGGMPGGVHRDQLPGGIPRRPPKRRIGSARRRPRGRAGRPKDARGGPAARRRLQARLTSTITACMIGAAPGAVPSVAVSTFADPAVSTPAASSSTHAPSVRETTPATRSLERCTATRTSPRH